MAGVMHVDEGGAMSTVQDCGRLGFRHLGIAVSGALDTSLLACANALAGNAADAAGLEMRLLGPTLRVAEGRIRLALAGGVTARIRRATGDSETLPAWRSVTLNQHDILQIGAVQGGVAYLAVAGGIAVPLQLGSRSTYVRAALGGIAGRALRTGDRLASGDGDATGSGEGHAKAFRNSPADQPIRVLLGPQDDHFKPSALAALTGSEYLATRDLDRMGMRLAGPVLEHVSTQRAEIISDGVTPGAIQVPANGQPIVLLADCQTVGGYPKIATVIRADLPRLAHVMPGQPVRFAAVTRQQALAALRELVAAEAAWRTGIAPLRQDGWIDEEALYNTSLVSGMVDMCSEFGAHSR